MKKTYWITGAVIAALLLGGGGFYGGILYQTRRANQLRTNFLASRGSLNDGQDNDGGNNPFFANGGGEGGGGGFRGAFGGGVTGQVKSLEGNVLQISTPQDVTTVNLSTTTVIQKYTAGATTDLQQGERVIVNGARDDKGNITATRIMILPDASSTTQAAP